MSLAAELSAGIRSMPDFILNCPLCSYLGIAEFPDNIRKPMLTRSRHNGLWSLIRCCQVSEGCEWLPSEASVAAWWRERRLEPLDDPALDARRQSTLAKLQAAGLEPETPIPMQQRKLITVCDKCLQASCWQGIFMCQEAQSAGIVQKTREELSALARENPCYWETDSELASASETPIPALPPCQRGNVIFQDHKFVSGSCSQCGAKMPKMVAIR